MTARLVRARTALPVLIILINTSVSVQQATAASTVKQVRSGSNRTAAGAIKFFTLWVVLTEREKRLIVTISGSDKELFRTILN